MDLDTHIHALQRQFVASAAIGGDDAARLAERLSDALAASIRMALLGALTDAADEITRELAPTSVELRLRGGEPEFVVSAMPDDAPIQERPAPVLEPAASGEDEGPAVRIALRVPESLKTSVEHAARTERLSVNEWLVRRISAAVAPPPGERPRGRTGRGESFTGWVS
jgi:hypothetical protein